jgi:hypothetical protein
MAILEVCLLRYTMADTGLEAKLLFALASRALPQRKPRFLRSAMPSLNTMFPRQVLLCTLVFSLYNVQARKLPSSAGLR